MSWFSSLLGTLEDAFQIGKTGVRLVVSGTSVVETRDAAGSALALHRASHPALGLNDLVTQEAARGYAPHFVKGTSPLNRLMIPAMAGATALTTGAPAANTIIALPFTVPWPCTLNRVLANVTTIGTLSNLRIGIYSATSLTNIYPGSRLYDSGDLSTITTGVKTASPALALTQGTLYWACLNQGGTVATIRCLGLAGCATPLGLDTAMGTAAGIGLNVSLTYGAYPASFPAGATVRTAVPIPAIGLELI